MSNRALLFFSGIIAICVLALFALNFSQLFSSQRQGKFLEPGYVSGVEVVHNKLPYTLNFEQQNDLINFFNISNKVNKKTYSENQSDLPFEKIVIYQFNKPNIEVIPVKISKNSDIVFKVADWNPEGYILDLSQGRMLNLIKTTYDD